MIQPRPIYETVLYADDLPSAARFYTQVLALPLLSQNDLMLVFQAGSQYLLIFQPEISSQPDRMVPSHGMSGDGHIAFAAPAESLEEWRKHLAQHHVPIEKEVTWDEGRRGVSIYFRDPAGNSVELAPPRLWSHLHHASDAPGADG